MSYRGLRAIVTGGLGFIGSNLAIRLVSEGARVTVVDSLVPGCGGNLHNLRPVLGDVHLLQTNIDDISALRPSLSAADVIFNLAGEISHVHSMQFPERDLQINTVSQLRFLLGCKEAARGIRVVFAGTRQVYGTPRYLPVDEAHPVNPVDFNGVHKYAATMYHQMLTRSGDLDARVLRLTNVYGPRMALDVACQGFLSTYIRKILMREQLSVYGDGKQLRDPMYVDDAVEAFLHAGGSARVTGRSFNVGGPKALSLAQIAQIGSELGACPEPRVVPFPADQKSFDIGSYHTNSSRFEREYGWKPSIAFPDGLKRTLEFYERELDNYLDGRNPAPPCAMPEHNQAHRLEYVRVRDESR